MDILKGVIDAPQIELFFTPDFTAEELSGRRAAIAGTIGDGAHLLVASAPPMPYTLKLQDANFYYFSGLDTCHSYLLVEGGSGRSTLFLPSRDTMSGELADRLGFEDVDLIRSRTGVEEVAASSEMASRLQGVMTLFVPHAEVEGAGASLRETKGVAERREQAEWDQAEPGYKRLIRLLTERVSGLQIEDALPLIARQRSIKSPAEIELLKKAAHLTATAIIEGMKATKPGITENDLQAIAEYVFRSKGKCGVSYACIIAGSQRTWNGHYNLNSMTLHEDDIVLMDCAPDLRHYTSDIGRIWPVGGTYSPWHRSVYGFITEYHKAIIGLIKPGAMLADIYKEAERRMFQLCDEKGSPYGDLKPMLEQMIQKGIGYCNHAVGMSAHDLCGEWKDEPLRENMVFVCDPMVWCEPQHQYIRVEDTLLVTADGCERLTAEAPLELDEIEALVGSGAH